MILIDFINLCDLKTKTENEKAKLLCYYSYKESGKDIYTMTDILQLFDDAGFSKPNASRLRDKLVKGNDKIFRLSKCVKRRMEFIPAILQTLEKELATYWNDKITIESDSELIDETKFCEKRTHLTRLIKQINSCYSNNCYDASAVLMRRLFEVMLILSYQKLGIEDEIIINDNYVMLEAIVKNAKNNKTLKLSRIKNDFDSFREVGNFSAHGITYIASKKDIDDIKVKYRVMLEELYNKAGLII